MLDRKAILAAQAKPRSGGDVAFFAMVFAAAVIVMGAGAGAWVYAAGDGEGEAATTLLTSE